MENKLADQNVKWEAENSKNHAHSLNIANHQF